MNVASMTFWVDNILRPYVELTRSMIGQDARCVLIGDGLKAHFNPIVAESLNKIDDLTVIPLPAHSSHFSQMLDATPFSSLKKRYASTPSDKSYESQLTRKIMRIKSAYDSTMKEELIRSAWEKTWFNLEIINSEVTSFSFSDEFKEYMRSQALHQDE